MSFRTILTLGALTASSFFVGVTVGSVLASLSAPVEEPLTASELDELIRKYDSDIAELERIIAEASDDEYSSDSTVHDYDAIDDASERTSASEEVDATAGTDEEWLNADDPEWVASLLRMAGVDDDDDKVEDPSGEPWYNRDQDCQAINHAMWEKMQCVEEELQKVQERNGYLKNNLMDTYREIELLEGELAAAANASCLAMETLEERERDLAATHEALQELRKENVGLIEHLASKTMSVVHAGTVDDVKPDEVDDVYHDAVDDSTPEEADDYTPEEVDDSKPEVVDEFMAATGFRRYTTDEWRAFGAAEVEDIREDFMHDLAYGLAATFPNDELDDFADSEMEHLILEAGEDFVKCILGEANPYGVDHVHDDDLVDEVDDVLDDTAYHSMWKKCYGWQFEVPSAATEDFVDYKLEDFFLNAAGEANPNGVDHAHHEELVDDSSPDNVDDDVGSTIAA